MVFGSQNKEKIDMQGQRTASHLRYISGPGDYWLRTDGAWHGVAPNGLMIHFKNHVEEHPDGTISVVTDTYKSNMPDKYPPVSWTGSIDHGVWKELRNETEY
jgi:hypothetical protein